MKDQITLATSCHNKYVLLPFTNVSLIWGVLNDMDEGVGKLLKEVLYKQIDEWY